MLTSLFIQDIPGELNDSTLEAKADSQHGDTVDSGPVGCCHLAFDAPGSEAPRDQDSMTRAQLLPSIVKLDSILVLCILKTA